MVEKGIRGRICYAIHRYAKVNNKYIKDYDKNKEILYLYYWDGNNLYGWTMSKKLPLGGFKYVEKTSQFSKDFTENFIENSDKAHFLEVDVQCPEKLHGLHNDLPFLSERMKIKKVEKLVANLHDKKEYVIHIKTLKQAINHKLVLKKCIESLN